MGVAKVTIGGRNGYLMTNKFSQILNLTPREFVQVSELTKKLILHNSHKHKENPKINLRKEETLPVRYLNL